MSERTRAAARGAAWLYALRWLERGADFVALVVLARLLAPAEFGLVAVAGSVVALIQGMSELDVGRALIRARGSERPLFDTAWTLGTARGVLCALVLVVASRFVDDPRLAAAVLALALGPLLAGLSNPRFVEFERDLRYSPLAAMTLAAKLVSVAVMLGVAWIRRDFWALVVGTLVFTAASTALSYALRPYVPRPSLARFRELFAFSGWMSLATAVTTLAMETDKLIVGRLVGIPAAGQYYMTQRIGVLPTRELISPLQRLLFPSLRSIADEPERLRRVVTESVGVLAALSLPAGFGFALIAAELVPAALGRDWTPTVPLLELLVPFLGLRATLSMTLPCAMALGRTRLLFRASLAHACLHLPLFVLGTALYDLMGAIVALLAGGALYVLLSAWVLHQAAGVRPLAIVRQLVRPLVAALAMVAAVLAVEPLTHGGAWRAVGVEVLLGAATYLVALLALWRAAGRPSGLERRLFQLVTDR